MFIHFIITSLVIKISVTYQVNLHALQCLLRVVPTLRDVLSSCLSSLLPAVGKNLTSKNVNISSTAENVLDSFIKHLGKQLNI